MDRSSSTDFPAQAPAVFGVEIDSDAGIPGLAAPAAVAANRHVRHRLVSAEEISERCGPGTLTLFGSDGKDRAYKEYHRHSSGGELMRTKIFGDHLIADEGQTILSSVKKSQGDLWQRFVVGQVLPVMASVQGLEIFHASAVSLPDGVVAFAGQSGVGKSTLAGAMIDGGASFYCDDVLAVEVTISGTTAFPGPALRSVAPTDAAAGGAKVAWADESKAVIESDGDREARPIRAFIALVRDETVEEPLFAPCPPNRLMASTFDALPRSPERLRRLLRVCAELAAGARAMELRFSARVPPSVLAEAVLRQLDVRAGAA